MKDSIFYGHSTMKDGELVRSVGQASLYKNFLMGIEEGQKVVHFIEAYNGQVTKPQLAKIHVCIRKLAIELGYEFTDMKNWIKEAAGLCIETADAKYYKSFSDCSHEEINLVMESLNKAGAIVSLAF